MWWWWARWIQDQEGMWVNVMSPWPHFAAAMSSCKVGSNPLNCHHLSLPSFHVPYWRTLFRYFHVSSIHPPWKQHQLQTKREKRLWKTPLTVFHYKTIQPPFISISKFVMLNLYQYRYCTQTTNKKIKFPFADKLRLSVCLVLRLLILEIISHCLKSILDGDVDVW